MAKLLDFYILFEIVEAIKMLIVLNPPLFIFIIYFKV